MRGAGDRVVPSVEQIQSNPFTSNAEKNSKTERYNDMQKIKEKYAQQNPSLATQPIVDLQVYPAPVPPQNKSINPKNFVPINTSSFGTQVMPNLQTPYLPYSNLPYSNVINPIPLIKNYSITIGGPETNHSQINAIYEDILPEKYYNNTFSTLTERKNIYTFIRSIFVKQHDGEDIALSGSKDNSLLRYMKFLDLNPYNPNMLSDNPYKGLPDNMLLYRSCYPIRKDTTTNSVQCASRSLGLNVRIYKLTNEEYTIKRHTADANTFDVWRELAYYEYVRDHIIRKMVCPNFNIMYSYHLAQNCDIDFDRINNFKRNIKGPVNGPRFVVRNNDGILDGSAAVRPGPVLTGGSKYKILQNGGNGSILNGAIQSRANIYGNQAIKPQFCTDLERPSTGYSGKAIVVLSEAPTSNLVTWASKVYKVNGYIRQMLNPGFHKIEVWNSILFQIMAAMYVLEINQIAFTNFSILDNIYIKELSIHENIKKYWIYKINGIDYYVPNYGFLVLIDSNFKDVDKNNLNNNELGWDDNKIYKIYSKMFDNNCNNLNSLCMKSFKNVFNRNVFSNTFINSGGSLPDDSVLNLIQSIGDDDLPSINDYLVKYMTMFMNNRVGTLLKEDEISNIQKDNRQGFRPGQIVVYEYKNNTYKFVIYLGKNDNLANILTCEEKTSFHDNKVKIISSTATIDMLYNYSVYEPITQNFKPNESNFSNENLMEIYTINKL